MTQVSWGLQKIVAMWSDVGVKWRGFIVIVALVVCVGAFVSSERSAEYETEKVMVGSVVSVITSVGTLKPFEEVEIHSAISGAVVEVLKEQGDKVAKGEALIRLEATALKSLYEKARSELQTTEAEFKYQSELYDKQLTSTNDYNKAKIATENARAEFTNAKKKFEAAEIVSPIDGTVLFRSVEVGRSIDNKGGVLMKIAGSFEKMRLLIRVSEADIGRVSEGQRVHFTVSAFKNQAFFGEIVSVPGIPMEGKGVVTYQVSASVENPNFILKSGMTADVTVKIAQVDNVIRIPTAALRFIPPDGSAHASEAGAVVWVKTVTGAIKQVPVFVGESNELYAEIKGGKLSEGDDVVVGIVSGSRGEDFGGMALPQPKRF